MATTLADVSGLSIKDVSAELRRISDCYGLRAPTKDPVHNEETRSSFEKRIGDFLSKNIVLTRGQPITRRSIEVVLVARRSPISREFEVPLSVINELVLVWALDLLRMGYRGFTKSGVLDDLKSEVIWLFHRRGHSLFSIHTLFCPFLNDWKRSKLYEMVVVNDGNIDVKPVTSFEVVGKKPICDECVALHEASI